MGVLFRRSGRSIEALRTMIADTMRSQVQVALSETPPPTPGATLARAEEIVRPAADAAARSASAREGGVELQVKPLLASGAFFFVLLGVSIVLDWKNVVDDPEVYSGMVTTVLGVVLGFLGGEAVGTASST